MVDAHNGTDGGQADRDQSMDVAFSQSSYGNAAALRDSRSAAALLLVGLSVVFLISIFYNPPDSGYISICMFKNLTGLPCPGCGLTHSFCALAKGRFGRAFGYNAVGPAIFVLTAGFWLRSIAVLLGRMKSVAAFDRIARSPLLWKLLLLVLGVYGAGRIVYIVLSLAS